jgi:cation:H+ antiporter
MLLDILYIIIGVTLVLVGADRLTEGASSLARRFGVPEIVIGLTIVACGTSAPEFFVSLMSALNGTPDMAIGNVVGSNIMNTMLIVGCAAMVAPMVISPSTVKKDIPFSVGASILLVLLAIDSVIGRIDGIILLVGFAVFMAYTLWQARSGKAESADAVKQQNPWLSVLFIVLGLAGLVFGSNLFVDSASSVATSLGVSESVIGLTIVAGGTSLPELATSVVAARKGQSAIAIGNVIGSNVFNILLILGATAAISPLQMEGITLVDIGVMLGSITLVWLFSFTRYTVERWEGAVLVLGYLAYLGWLLSNV